MRDIFIQFTCKRNVEFSLVQKRKSRDEMQLRSGLQKRETAQIGRAAVDHFAGYSPRSAEEGGGRSAGNCFASGKKALTKRKGWMYSINCRRKTTVKLFESSKTAGRT